MQRTRTRRSAVTRGIVLAAVMTLALAGCDWPMFHGGPERPGYNPESTIANDSRASLSTLFTAGQTDAIESSPAVAYGMVYVGGDDNLLHAYPALPKNCPGSPGLCQPTWTGATDDD